MVVNVISRDSQRIDRSDDRVGSRDREPRRKIQNWARNVDVLFLDRWKSMTNGRPLGKVLCIAGGRAPKFQARLRRADLGVGQAEKQELRAGRAEP